MTNIENLYEALKTLRLISHDWSDKELVIEDLINVRDYLRYETVMTKELFDLYDKVVISLMILVDEINEIGFDGRIFTSVMTEFGIEDFTRDDYDKYGRN